MRKIKYISFALLLAANLTGCSDQFLEDKREYGTYDESLVYENFETAEQRVNYLYQLLLPRATGSTDEGTDFLTIFLMVISFYFGSQSQKLQNILDGGDDHGDSQ